MSAARPPEGARPEAGGEGPPVSEPAAASPTKPAAAAGRRRLWPSWPALGLQTYFVAVILLATVPIALVLTWRVLDEAASARARLASDLSTAAHALAQRVDRELTASYDGLTALADAMPERDTARFETLLRARLKQHDAWHSAFVADAQGRVVLDTVAAAAPPADRAELAALVRAVHAAGARRASGLIGTGAGAHVLLAVPVDVQTGRPPLVLGVRSPATFWRSLIAVHPQTSPGGFVRLFDDRRRLIAGSADHLGVAGHVLPDGTGAPRGVQRIPMADGAGALVVRRALAEARWTVGAGAPAAPLEKAERDLVLKTITTTGASLLLGVALALGLAIQVTRPLQGLAGAGSAEPARGLAIREIQALRADLGKSRRMDRQVRQQLQRRASEFETLFHSSPIGLAFSRDPLCRAVQRNPAMDALLGGDQLPPGSVEVLHAGQRIAPAQQPLQRACREGVDVPTMELQVLVAGRPPVYLMASAVALRDADGATVGGLSAVMDITALKSAQARLEAAHDALRAQQAMIDLVQLAGHAGFLQFRFRRNELVVSPGMAQLLGLSPVPAPPQLQHWLAAIDAPDRAAVRRQLAQALARGETHASFVYRVALPEGEPARWLSHRVVLSYQADGRPEQMVGVATDATEHKEAERLRHREAEREHAALQEAAQSSKAKDEFLLMLGHELRNPLGAISAAAEVLDAGAAGTPVGARAVAILLHQTQRLTRLLNALLDMADAVAGDVKLTLQPVNLAPLVARACEAVEAVEGKAGPRIALSLAPTWVMVDALRIEQVVTQLVENALRHTPAGTAVSVRLSATAAQAVLEVADAGPGIAPELRQRMFELFAQGERTLDRAEGGLGVGLTLVRRLVLMHGGTVHADSGAQGSVFTVRLPLYHPEEGAVGPGRDALALPRQPVRRIVLVDDQEDVCQAVAAMLAVDGHDVTTAADGHAGLALLLDHWPDVALIDIGLPGLDGLELARRARRQGYAGRMIAISGYGRASAVHEARRAGFDAYLVKPVTRRQLLAAMDDRRDGEPPL
jgi:signal transduction histidine kinase/ActR/RegA family two-component response regulator